jgi:tRNA/tmRNA/rRNA uracil-C5-methylase (TrmA/RlmC/RlmD family)
MREAVIREAGSVGVEGRVLDAYCGAGIYGRELARQGRECIGIELDPGAVAAAREGAPEGFSVLGGRVEDRLGEVLPVGVAILNPPRTGAGSAVMEAIRSAGVKRVVYVSCDPATLARDTQAMSGEYRIAGFEIFDLFPQTAHVESLLTLERVAP